MPIATEYLFEQLASEEVASELPNIRDLSIDEMDKWGFYALKNAAATSALIPKAIELLYVKAQNELRHFNPIPARIHSLSVANDFAIVAHEVFSETHLSDIENGIVEAVLHDTIEDFKAKYMHISLELSCPIADNVWLMTTPSYAELALDFHDITQNYLDTHDLTRTVEHYGQALDDFQRDCAQSGSTRYEELRAGLKLAYKTEVVEKFIFRVAIIKALDSLKSLEDYANDIEQRRILIDPYGGLGKAQLSDDGSTFILSSRELQRNITDRETYHRQVMAHITKLAQNPSGYAPESYAAACEILNSYFYSVKGRLEQLNHKLTLKSQPLALLEAA